MESSLNIRMNSIQYKCSRCDSVIPLEEMTEYRKRRKKLVCDACKKNAKKEYDANLYSDNSELIKNRVKSYVEDNRDKVSERRRKYRNANADKIRKNQREYKIKNRAIRWQKEKARLLIDSDYALKKRLRNNLLASVKNNQKAHNRKPASIFTLLGCSYIEFKQYFESKFTEGMSWEIFTSTSEIHIDHIIPVSKFDLSDLEQAKQCFHYSNLQPLWRFDNLSKGSKMPDEINKSNGE